MAYDFPSNFLKDKKEWIVVFFRDGGAEPVPDFWITTDKQCCIWPPKKDYNNDKMYRALKERRNPKDNWEICKIRAALFETGTCFVLFSGNCCHCWS